MSPDGTDPATTSKRTTLIMKTGFFARPTGLKNGKRERIELLDTLATIMGKDDIASGLTISDKNNVGYNNLDEHSREVERMRNAANDPDDELTRLFTEINTTYSFCRDRLIYINEDEWTDYQQFIEENMDSDRDMPAESEATYSYQTMNKWLSYVKTQDKNRSINNVIKIIVSFQKKGCTPY
ncbi:unnamed protein product [Absidia cylindrospora]